MKKHELKVWPEYFDALEHPDPMQRKTCEIRINDRDYQVGDELILHEWDNEAKAYTGRKTVRIITHMVEGRWVPEDVVVLSLCKPKEREALYLEGHKDGKLEGAMIAARAYTKSPTIPALTAKPIWHHRWICSCGMGVGSPIEEQNYCSDCGAKLDYSEWKKRCQGIERCMERCDSCKVVNGRLVKR